ncbi:hypothetical protein ONZ45_g3543 [Pleurotus djamor]|nr:hypothetical protein ONZ45_g3543 [Pleurotus djamor]
MATHCLSTSSTAYYGAVVNPKSLRSYDAHSQCLMVVSSTGKIVTFREDISETELHETLKEQGHVGDIVKLKDDEFIMPGFIDTHTHAPQFPNLAVGQEYELLDWLENYTFPTEARFCSDAYALAAYEKVVQRSLDLGTTTSCYYASRHIKATKILADIVHEKGQRAFIGKYSMDSPEVLPEYYRDSSAQESLEDTEALIHHIRSLGHNGQVPLVEAIITPRFALGCTPELLEGLGNLAEKEDKLCIQTHISENTKEIEQVEEKFGMSYTDVYHHYNLLRRGTILGHGIHLSDKELELIKRCGAGVSHCPTSNFNLRSGIAQVAKYLDMGVKVGLGTDVSGGFSPSMLTAIRDASIASKVVTPRFLETLPGNQGHKGSHGHHRHEDKRAREDAFSGRQLTVATLLYLATLGGAHLCKREQEIGSFEEGKSFDALLVSLKAESGNPEVWQEQEGLKKRLERFFYCGDDRNILKVWVQGRLDQHVQRPEQSTTMTPTVYYGAVVNPLTLTSYQALPQCLLAISSEGTIAWMVEDVPDSMVQDVMSENGWTDAEVVMLKQGEFLMPGFIDTHTHAPQVPNMGSGQQYELLQWLDNVTFPMEANFADVNFAKETYTSVVRRIINCGTTTCCYYGTLHAEGTKILADIVHASGNASNNNITL